ncbi:hypothetical protein MUTS14_00400 (plasmid) [Escherichia coli]|nr:hypothetical protein MUTS14_00400 [Escherichia coli]
MAYAKFNTQNRSFDLDKSILLSFIPHKKRKTVYSSFEDLFFRSIDRMIAKTQNFDLFLRRKDEQAN